MDSMLFIIAIFVSIFIAFGMVVIATTIRKLREEVVKLGKENWKLEHDYYNLKEQLREKVAKLKEENTKLKDENHSLSCSEKSLLWQRQNLRNEILRLISDSKYYYEQKEFMHDNFKKVGVYKNGRQSMPFSEAWNIAVKMIYNWS